MPKFWINSIKKSNPSKEDIIDYIKGGDAYAFLINNSNTEIKKKKVIEYYTDRALESDSKKIDAGRMGIK